MCRKWSYHNFNPYYKRLTKSKSPAPPSTPYSPHLGRSLSSQSFAASTRLCSRFGHMRRGVLNPKRPRTQSRRSPKPNLKNYLKTPNPYILNAKLKPSPNPGAPIATKSILGLPIVPIGVTGLVQPTLYSGSQG